MGRTAGLRVEDSAEAETTLQLQAVVAALRGSNQHQADKMAAAQADVQDWRNRVRMRAQISSSSATSMWTQLRHEMKAVLSSYR